jgi:hypothetical protein
LLNHGMCNVLSCCAEISSRLATISSPRRISATSNLRCRRMQIC